MGLLKVIMCERLDKETIKELNAEKEKADLRNLILSRGKKNLAALKEKNQIFDFNDITRILEKNSCADIFKDIVLDANSDKYTNTSLKNFITYKFAIKKAVILFERLRLFLCLKLCTGSLYLRLILRKIQLAKDILLFCRNEDM